ncbi:hypothetical protein POJ06DRAFT_234779 [Lipomyces tetrasporus]|uniref:Uncharacterized protein n=1 Tax=Lipomyces tetrasporus TaxID=54092 RepID=A0AAD7VVR7_9ASCO|nr:uncharacterized protein POJ06DRAFT_234779 [Lipomyces tetrasporus]KAJ8103793.1 hypothetical protein POJ06DRAFT_234779 [Lipomyces tetrasporus]
MTIGLMIDIDTLIGEKKKIYLAQLQQQASVNRSTSNAGYNKSFTASDLSQSADLSRQVDSTFSTNGNESSEKLFLNPEDVPELEQQLPDISEIAYDTTSTSSSVCGNLNLPTVDRNIVQTSALSNFSLSNPASITPFSRGNADAPHDDGQSASDRHELVLEAFRQIIQLDVAEDSKRLIGIALEKQLNLKDVFLAGQLTSRSRKRLNLGDLFVSGLRFIYQEKLPIHPSSSPSPPCPGPYYQNSIQRVSTLDAYLWNAKAIGVPVARFYGENCSSPFYRPQISSMDELKALQLRYARKIPPHLRPTTAQIIYPIIHSSISCLSQACAR